MKLINKKIEPRRLRKYRRKHPLGIWQKVPARLRRHCRYKCMKQQGNICCYCECSLHHPTIKNFCRVEHFHQKSDTVSAGKNWHLDWQNMLAACNGKTDKNKRKKYPHPNNLSCDSYKNYLIQTGRLSIQCEGLIMNPLQLAAFPNLFKVDGGSGELKPDDSACSQVLIPGNKLATTKDLVQNTIDSLNLNCDRLRADRRTVLLFLNQRIAQEKKAGKRPDVALPAIVHQYFSKKWPAYFTTIRCRLGKYAEDYLHSIAFQG